MRIWRNYRLLWISLAVAMPIVGVKFLLHMLGWEIVTLSTLHGSVLTGAFFVLGFILSATIADYKESEKIPAEIASAVHNMYDDAVSIHDQYPKFSMTGFTRKLHRIAASVGEDMRNRSYDTQEDISALSEEFLAMERAGVPANFIVKLKQQQAQLSRVLLRVAYIQRIRFVPSAMILARCVTALSLLLIMITEIEPFYGGLAVVAIIAVIFAYVLQLIELISVPFHPEGKTRDDVSMFLVEHVRRRLEKVLEHGKSAKVKA